VRLKKRQMKLGLGGVAKGWAVDRAVATLRALGLKDFFVQAGDDLNAAGQRGDRPWRVGIRDPVGTKDQYFAQMDVSNAAVYRTRTMFWFRARRRENWKTGYRALEIGEHSGVTMTSTLTTRVARESESAYSWFTSSLR